MDTDWLIALTKQVGPLAAVSVMVAWSVIKSINKIVDRHLKGFDKLSDRMDAQGAAIAAAARILADRVDAHAALLAEKFDEHTQAAHTIELRVERLDSKIDAWRLNRPLPGPKKLAPKE